MRKKEIGRGAEAVIYLSTDRKKSAVIKDRPIKAYRHPELDFKIRSMRAKKEAKILDKLSISGFASPELLRHEGTTLTMQFLDGKQLKDVLTKKNCRLLGKKIGTMIAKLHAMDIVHGDLTTSNMLYKDKKVYFIDFGLAQHSKRAEDMAVDLHLLRQALESKHYQFWKQCYEAVLQSYNTFSRAKEVLTRLEKVELRGRNKQGS